MILAIDLPLTDPIESFAVLLLILLLSPLLATRLKLPPLVVLIILGCLLGTNVLGVLARDQQLIFLEKIGLLYIMLLAGLQMDLSNLKRLGVRSLLFGWVTFGIPLAIGIGSGLILTMGVLSAVLLGLMYSPHTLIAYPSMTRLGIAQRESIGVAVGGTVVTSILTLVGFAVVQAIAQGQVSGWLWIKLLIFLPLFTGLSFWGIPSLGRQLLISPQAPLILPFLFVLATLFVSAVITQLLGVDAIVGAFIAGLALNRLIPLKSPLMARLEFVGNGLFIPAFMVSVGVLSDPKIFITAPGNLGLALLVVAGAVGAKFLAAGVTGRSFNYAWDEIMTVFSLTISRAALVLVMPLFGKEVGLFDAGIFNAAIAYIVITCLLGPLLAEFFGRRLATQTLSGEHP